MAEKFLLLAVYVQKVILYRQLRGRLEVVLGDLFDSQSDVEVKRPVAMP